MRSLADLRSRAEDTVARYVDPSAHYAFATYDVAPTNTTGSLLPDDILIANLLSLRLSWKDVVPLFATGDGPPQQLLVALNDALCLTTSDAFETFETEDDLTAALEPLAAANRATRAVPRWTPVTVSKVLHRFAPQVVPIVDSRVRAFYGVRAGQEAELRRRLWADLRDNIDWLRPIADAHQTRDRRQLTVLRLADILIWTPDSPVDVSAG